MTSCHDGQGLRRPGARDIDHALHSLGRPGRQVLLSGVEAADVREAVGHQKSAIGFTGEPVPIMAFHGTDDACVPYDGGTTTCGAGSFPIAPVEQNLAAWATFNGCDVEPATAPVSENVSAISYDACPSGTAAVLYRIDGGGHTWPGSIDVRRLGVTTHEIDATALIWAFFEAHRGAQ